MEGEQISKVEKGTRDHHQYLCYPLCCENEEVAAEALPASLEEYLQLALCGQRSYVLKAVPVLVPFWWGSMITSSEEDDDSTAQRTR